MSMISWLVVLGVAVFFILIGIKMVPVYLENESVKHVLTTMENDRTVRRMTPNEMKNNFMKRLKINSVYEFDRAWFKTKKEKFGTRILVEYEVRKPVAGNVEILMSFSESALIGPP